MTLIRIALVALVATACGGGGGGDGGPGPTTDAVTMLDNEFQPSNFTAASDSIVITNDGQTLHNVTISQADIDEDLQPGASAHLDLSGLDPGRYDFDCKYHPEMTGAVTVR
jgi:plastocyanin